MFAEVKSQATAGRSLQMSRVRSRTAGASVSVVCKKSLAFVPH